jgi:hypothetical protein
MPDERNGDQNSWGPRTLAGLMLAPIVGGAVSAFSLIGAYVLYELSTGGPGSAFLSMLSQGYGLSLITVMVLQYGIVIGCMISFVIGLPAHLALQKLKITGPVTHMAGGALIAATGFLFVLLVTDERQTQSMWPEGSFIVVLLAGGIGGLTFWLIRRPDRDALQGGLSRE